MLVLIVEDDPIVAMDLEDIILEQTYARVMICGSVRKALPLLEEPIDFAVFDLDLEDGDSLALATTLLKRNVPFIFVSGASREALPETLRGAPFMPKPYVEAEIGRAVAKASLQAA